MQDKRSNFNFMKTGNIGKMNNYHISAEHFYIGNSFLMVESLQNIETPCHISVMHRGSEITEVTADYVYLAWQVNGSDVLSWNRFYIFAHEDTPTKSRESFSRWLTGLEPLDSMSKESIKKGWYFKRESEYLFSKELPQ